MKALLLATSPVAPLDRFARGAMLRLGEVPILEIQLDLLRQHGVSDVLLGLGQGGEAIADHFGDGRRFGVRMASLWSRRAAFTIADLRTARSFLDDSFLLLSANALVATDFDSLLAEHHRACAHATIVRPGTGPDPADINLMLIEPAALTRLPAATPLADIRFLASTLGDHGAIVHRACLPLTGHPVMTPAQYLDMHWQCLAQAWPGGAPHGQFHPSGLRCGINVRIDPRRCRIQGPVQIDGGACIEDGASLLGPCHIGAGAVIEAGACIERSVVLAHARVGGHAHLRNAITDGRHCLLDDGTRIELEHADLGWLIGLARQSGTSRGASEQRFLDRLS